MATLDRYEVAIAPDGTMVLRRILETATSIPEAMLVTLGAKSPHHVRHLLNANQVVGAEWQGYFGPVFLTTTVTEVMIVVQVDALNLRAAVRVLEEGVVGPKFARQPQENTVPFRWAPPKNMRLFFATHVHYDHGALVYYQDQSYLFAMDEHRATWRLPTSNVHNDCRICMGTYNSRGRTAMESLRASLEQFLRSDWNQDLAGGADEHAAHIFRFQAVDDGFKQLPIATNWTPHCQKVATALIDTYKGVIP